MLLLVCDVVPVREVVQDEHTLTTSKQRSENTIIEMPINLWTLVYRLPDFGMDNAHKTRGKLTDAGE